MSLERALLYIYAHHISRPYLDAGDGVFRGQYMLRTGRMQPYPISGDPQAIPDALYRINYGLAYVVRFVSDIRSAACLVDSFDEISLQKLEIVAAFLSVGKKTDHVCCSEQETDAEQLYKDGEKSAEIFAEFARNYKTEGGDLFFSGTEIDHYKSVLMGACSTQKTMRVFKLCESMQAMRDTGCITFPDESLERQNAPFLKKNEIKIILTGESRKTCFDSRKNKFVKTDTLKRLALFQLANTDLLVCNQLIALSYDIKSNTQAEALAFALNLYAIEGRDALLDVLREIKDAPDRLQKIVAIIAKHDNELSNIDDARLIKTVKVAWWKTFKKTLVAPQSDRPELRKIERPLPYTVRLRNDGPYYEVVSTQKGKRQPRFDLTEKLKRTRHQAVTLANWKKGLNPPPFQTGDLQAVSIGISVPCSDAAFARIAIYNPYRASYGRCFDYPTGVSANNAIKLGIASGNLHVSLNNLQKQELTKNLNRLSEVDAYLEWRLNGRSHITIFNDNLNSRLFSQLCALDLQNDFHCDIPISYYPDTQSFYTDAEKIADLRIAEHSSGFVKYVVAIEMMKQQSLYVPPSHLPIKKLLEAYDLLMEVNEHVAEMYLASLRSHKISEIYHAFLDVHQKPEYAPIFSLLNPLQIPSSETELSLVDDLLSKMEFVLYLINKKEDIQSCINSFEDYYRFLQICTHNIRVTFLAMTCMKPFVVTVEGFRSIFNLLVDPSEKTIFIEMHKDRFLDLSFSGVKNLMKNLSHHDEENFFIIMKNSILMLAAKQTVVIHEMARILNGQFFNFLQELKTTLEKSGLKLVESHLKLLSDKKISSEKKQFFLTVFSSHIKTSLSDPALLILIAKNSDEETLSCFAKIMSDTVRIIMLNANAEKLAAAMVDLFYLDDNSFLIMSKLMLNDFPLNEMPYQTVFLLLKEMLTQKPHRLMPIPSATAFSLRNSYIINLVERLACLTTTSQDFLKFAFFRTLLSEKKSRAIFFRITLPKLTRMLFTTEQFMRAVSLYFMHYPELPYFDNMADKLIDIIHKAKSETNWNDFTRCLTMTQSKIVLRKIKEIQLVDPDCPAANQLLFGILKKNVLEKIDGYLVKNTVTRPIGKKSCVEQFKALLLDCRTILEIQTRLKDAVTMSASVVSNYNKGHSYFFRVSDDCGALFSECLAFIKANTLMNNELYRYSC